MDDRIRKSPDGTVGDVVPGSLLGPVVGLTFSADGELLFACSGSSLSVYGVRSGSLLSTVPVFTPGVAVYGVDVGRERLGAIFGDKCVRIVDGVPTGAEIPASTITPAASAWFRVVVRLPDLDDRVWDARLIGGDSEDKESKEGEGRGLNSSTIGRRVCSTGVTDGLPFQGTEKEEGEEEGRRGAGAGMRMVALALAHNSVEVWDWATQTRPFRILRARGGDPCLLYHARLWGRTLNELRVAAGTVFNQVLVWSPGMHFEANRMDSKAHEGSYGKEVPPLKEGIGLLWLKGHEGVIFRVAWREDGKQLASASDDRTARVWDVEPYRGSCSAGRDDGVDGDDSGDETKRSGGRSGCGRGGERKDGGDKGRSADERLLWTGWGHASRVWDVGFTRVGLVTCGEDGSAILWRQECSLKDDLNATAASVLAIPAPKPTSNNNRRGGQLVPAALMRGHSGASVWRLAVHELASRPTAAISEEKYCRVALGESEIGRPRQDSTLGLALMATGGNDGACKLWDLGFEAACERRQPSDTSGTLWGQTAAVPDATAADLLTTNTVSTGETAVKVAAAKPPGGPAVESESEWKLAAVVAAAAAGAVKLNCNPTEPAIGEQRQGRGEGRASRNRRRRQKPAVVREIRLVRDTSGTTAAVAAALLLADGSVWWVADLAVGTWQPVTVMGATGGAGQGSLCSSGVSAIAVVSLHRRSDDDIGNHTTVGKEVREESVASQENDGRCSAGKTVAPLSDSNSGGTGGDEVAIVAGRDDGWLFLLTQNHPPPAVASPTGCDKPEGAATDRREGNDDRPALMPGPWTVRAAWKGHRSRVTAMWVVGDVTATQTILPDTSQEGRSQPFTAALDTSRVGKAFASVGSTGDSGGFCGALVSAGADGTVAWWEWSRGVGGGGIKSSREARSPPAKLRMVCQAGPGAVVTSIAIDDRRRRQRCSPPFRDNDCSEDQEEEHPIGSKPTPNAEEGRHNDTPPLARAVVYCGDTKGNIRCFLEEGPRFGSRNSKVCFEERGVVDEGGRDRAAIDKEGVRPCSVLKRQHGNNQVSRIALLGDCLFSAGHDGQVNHYAISYSASSFDFPLGDMTQAADATAATPTATGRASSPVQPPATPRETQNDNTSNLTSQKVKRPPSLLPEPPESRSPPPVDLTILTTYATAPVTAVFDLWVGSNCCDKHGDDSKGVDDGGNCGDAICRRKLKEENVRIAVAGRSGSSRMSVWDVTEARQLLELECGDRHLAHDLLLSWSPIERTPIGRAETVLDKGSGGNSVMSLSPDRSNTGTCDHTFLGNDSSSGVIVEASSAKPRAALTRTRTADFAATPRSLGLPRHAFVVARPVSTTETINNSNRGIVAEESAAALVDDERSTGLKAGESCPVNKAKKAFAIGAVEHHHHHHHQGQAPFVHEGLNRRHQSGVALAFHSSFASLDGGSCGKDGGSVVGVEGPDRFEYSLGKPFHGQRVASARFIVPEAGEACRHSRSGLSDLRLVTGGEEGSVKLLDVFYRQQRQQQHPRHAGNRTAFHLPYARAVQTFPSHESSVGALAVGKYDGGSERPSGRRPTLIVSGGGKLEARAWHVAGDQSVDDGVPSGSRTRAARTMSGVTGAPPVRWLSTTTPAPKSPLHAHRIMCMCVLPPPLRPSSHPDSPAASVFVSGDSGGGVSAFELRHSTDTAAGGQRETRSHHTGRWMAPGKRPVLCLAHARVIPAAAAGALPASASPHSTVRPPAVVDLIATGDTGGTVTVWQSSPGGSGGGGAVLPSGDSEGLPQAAVDVGGGFVHRGPAGRRRGGEREGTTGGIPGPSLGLVRVLDYRAHQMGVLCMAVHVPEEGGRVIIVTGGDDQAICVAELEVLHDRSAQTSDPHSPRGEEGGHNHAGSPSGQTSMRQSGRPALAFKLVGGLAEVQEGAAGSAIKGISLIPPVKPLSHAVSPAASVFTVSRDQRLSRWDLMEEKASPLLSLTSDPTPVHVSTSDKQEVAGLSHHFGDCPEGLNLRLPPQGGRDGSGKKAWRGGGKEGEVRKRWRLRWRAGCVTDVCDISGLDAVLVPGEPRMQQREQQQQRRRQQQQRPPIVDDESCGDCDSRSPRNGGGNLRTASYAAATTSGEQEAKTPVEHEPGEGLGEGGAMQEALPGPNSSKEGIVSPAALVVVSGQGLQLVLFGAY